MWLHVGPDSGPSSPSVMKLAGIRGRGQSVGSGSTRTFLVASRSTPPTLRSRERPTLGARRGVTGSRVGTDSVANRKLPGDPDPPEAGDVPAVEGYTIERELGRGGEAIVYLARELHTGRRVAIKILRPELAASLHAERFLQEIQIISGLVHPNILPLLHSGRRGGVLYYVAPYVEGESLRAHLEREGQLSIAEAVRIVREVAYGLDYACRHGVVHRDIKPENILL